MTEKQKKTPELDENFQIAGDPLAIKTIYSFLSRKTGQGTRVRAMEFPGIGVLVIFSDWTAQKEGITSQFLPGTTINFSADGQYRIIKKFINNSEFPPVVFPYDMPEIHDQQPPQPVDNQFPKELEKIMLKLVGNITKQSENRDKNQILDLMEHAAELAVKHSEVIDFFAKLSSDSPAKQYADEVLARYRGVIRLLDSKIDEILEAHEDEIENGK